MAATGAGIGPSSVIESLVSGSRHVDEFGDEEDYTSDSDGDVEEEVSYVTLDLGQIHPTLLPSCSTCRIAGLDTPTPYMQLGSTIFKGQHQTLIGTELYFTEQRDPDDPSRKFISPFSSTSQRISFKEVQLRPKGSVEIAEKANEARKAAGSKAKGKAGGKDGVPTKKRTRTTRASAKTEGNQGAKTTTRAKGKGKEVVEASAGEDLQDTQSDYVPD